MIHIVFCVIYCVFYLIHGLFFVFDIVSADMLSLITMIATCGLILNETSKTYKKNKSPIVKFLVVSNVVIGIVYIILMVAFTIMYFAKSDILLECAKGIALLPIVITLIASCMNIMRKENRNEEKIITCYPCCRRFITFKLRRR